MGYLSHRFSSLTSLVMLLMMTVGTAWLFSFAARTNTMVENLLDTSITSENSVLRAGQSARASSTILR